MTHLQSPSSMKNMPACIKGLLDHVVRIKVLVRVDFGSELLFDISEIGILTGHCDASPAFAVPAERAVRRCPPRF